MQKKLSIVIPIYNEEKSIPELYSRLKKSVSKLTKEYEFIFINDGSCDKSLFEILKIVKKDKRVFYINFSRNFGHQIAVSAGLEISRGSAVVIIDADLQDPPELIPKLYETYKQGYDVVYAKREQRKGDTFFKKITAKLFYRLLKKLTSIDIPLDTGDFRLIDKKIVEYLKQMPEQNKFLRGQIAWLGFKQTDVSFSRDQRKYGKTGYSFNKMLDLAIDGITSFSNKPLQLVTKLGLAISFAAFIVILYAMYSHFILDQTVSGWTSIMVSSMLIGGVQLVSIGIIGEYISRISKNTINRPLYIVESSNWNKNSISKR